MTDLWFTSSQEAFKTFLIGFITSGHTVDDNVMEELTNFTDEFVSFIPKQFYFTSDAVEAYIDDLDYNISEENRHWFPLKFNERRYIKTLESWIKDLIQIHSD